jgi:hypothetical protein
MVKHKSKVNDDNNLRTDGAHGYKQIIYPQRGSATRIPEREATNLTSRSVASVVDRGSLAMNTSEPLTRRSAHTQETSFLTTQTQHVPKIRNSTRFLGKHSPWLL